MPQPRILVLAHRTELIDQISDTLQNKYHITCGIIKSGFTESQDTIVQVASVQSLSRRLARWQNVPFQYIVIDEAHHALAKTYKNICNSFPDAYILGVTATPYRLSGEGFRKMFGALVTSMPVQKFIEQGYLSAFRYYSIPIDSELQYDINNVSEYGADGDYLERVLCDICDNAKIRAKLVKAYNTYAKGKKGIVYTINKRHNKSVAEQYRAEGLRVADIDSDTPIFERNKVVNDFKNGKIDIICNVNIFSEGFDCPDLEFVQLARPTQSLSLYLQQVGRALRTSPNKSQAIILDNVGIYNKFGLPNQLIDWHKYFNLSGNNIAKIISKAIANRPSNTRKINESDEEMILIEETHLNLEDYANEKYSLLGTIQTMEQYPIGFKIDIKRRDILLYFTSSYESLDEYISDMESEYAFDDDGNIDEYSLNGKILFNTYKYEYNGKYGVCRIKNTFNSLNTIQENVILTENAKFEDYFDSVLEPIYDELAVPNSSQFIICCIEGKYGVIDSNDNRDLISCKYDEIEEFTNIGYIVAKNGKYGVIGYDGEFSIPMKYDGIFPVDSIKKWYFCLKNDKLISLVDSKDIYRMTDFIGNISENYYISKFNRGNSIYVITNKEGEILVPTLANYIFFTENKDEICFQYKSHCIFTDTNLNLIRVEHKQYHNKHIIPDFYFPKRLKEQQQVKENKEQPRIKKTTTTITANVIEKCKTSQATPKKVDSIDKFLNRIEKRAQKKGEKQELPEITDIKSNNKKRPRLKTSDIERLKQNRDLNEYKP